MFVVDPSAVGPVDHCSMEVEFLNLLFCELSVHDFEVGTNVNAHFT